MAGETRIIRSAQLKLREASTAVCLIALLLSGIAGAQTPAGTTAVSDSYELRVAGEVEHELKLGLAKLHRKTVHAKDHSGQESAFEGVAVVDILQLAGVKFGEALRGKGLALYLVVEASDGYRAVFAWPELDPAFTDSVILLADRKDGGKLGFSEGPLRIIVPGEKRQARWVRQVTSFIIKRA